MNALAVFFLSTLLARLLVLIRVSAAGRPRALQSVLYEAVFAPWAPPAIASLGWAIANVVFWVLVMWLLWRRGVRLTV